MTLHALFIFKNSKISLNDVEKLMSAFVRVLPDELNQRSGSNLFSVDDVSTEYVGASEHMPADVDLHVRIEATPNDSLTARQEEAEQSIQGVLEGLFSGLDLGITTQLRLGR